MIDTINNIFHSDIFLMAFYGFFFIDGIFMVIFGFWIGRHSYIKKMDIIFSGYSPDYGIWLNAYRAFAYGMSMLFPGTLGKRVHKNVDISKINKKDKYPYILYALSMLVLFPYFIVFPFYELTSK